jgi:hypothetical protein
MIQQSNRQRQCNGQDEKYLPGFVQEKWQFEEVRTYLEDSHSPLAALHPYSVRNKQDHA